MSKIAVNDIQSLRRILKENNTIAVVGLSKNWYRPSFFAAKYLLEHGYRIIPVNPNYSEILGQKCYPTLEDIPEKIDVVDIFQKPEAVAPLAESAISIRANVLWMQLGIFHEESAKKAHEAGLDVVMDKCMKIEHARLFGGLGFIGVDTKVISSARPQWLP